VVYATLTEDHARDAEASSPAAKENQQVDADEARTFLRHMTDELIEMVGRLQQAQRNEAAVRAVAQVRGAAIALSAATGMPREVIREATATAAQALADLGYLDRALANWWGAESVPRFAVPPEQDQQAERSAGALPGPRLVRVLPLIVEVGPDHAGAMMVFTALEFYEDRMLAHFSRLGGDPAQDDPVSGYRSWTAKDDTGLEYRALSGSRGALPFQTGSIEWMPAPAEGATSLLVTVLTAAGPEPVMLPLRD
jgi:hypothetical protein